MLSLCLTISAIFVVIVNAVALTHKGGGVGLAILWSLGGVVGCFFLCMGTLVPLLNALLVAGAGVVCWALRARPRWFLASSLIATVAAYVLVALPDLWAWHRLKNEYPLESVAGRLAYENRPRTAPTPLSTEVASGLPAKSHLASLAAGVAEEERKDFFSGRTQSLKRLHAGVVQQFIDSPGFGVERRIRPDPYYLEHEQQESQPPIPQPTPPYSPADLAPAPLQVASEPGLLTAHDDNSLDFLDPMGFGYIQDREHVAGFRPHHFHDNPKAPGRWQVKRLELVSLLKHDEPAVYLSANFPRMDELSQAPTRPLDAFETEALAKLRRGEDLMVQETPTQMRMLGSIRAVQQCLQCHNVQNGELLGAFSYRLSAGEPLAK